MVRSFVDARIRPEIADWFDRGTLPARELARELGELGVLGMHLEGYGCAGTSAVAYGLACLELEAGDSGIRSLVSVQGSLAMFAIHAFGSEEHKQQWLPGMAAGEKIGCFGLTEADFGSNPSGMRTNAKRDGDDWVLNGSKMDHQRQHRRRGRGLARTDDGIRGFVVPTDTAGSVPTRSTRRCPCAPGHQRVGPRGRVTARGRGAAWRRGPTRPAAPRNEARFGIVFDLAPRGTVCKRPSTQHRPRTVRRRSRDTSFDLKKASRDMTLELG